MNIDSSKRYHAFVKSNLSNENVSSKTQEIKKNNHLMVIHPTLSPSHILDKTFFLDKIFSDLSLKEQAQARLVCKSWKQISLTNEMQCYRIIIDSLWENSKPRVYNKETHLHSQTENPNKKSLKEYSIIFKRPYSWEKIKEALLKLLFLKTSSQWANQWLTKIEEIDLSFQNCLQFAHPTYLEELSIQMPTNGVVENAVVQLIQDLKQKVLSFKQAVDLDLKDKHLTIASRNVLEMIQTHWEELIVFLEWPEVPMSAHHLFVKIIGSSSNNSEMHKAAFKLKEPPSQDNKINTSVKALFKVREDQCILLKTTISIIPIDEMILQTPTGLKVEEEKTAFGFSPSPPHPFIRSNKQKLTSSFTLSESSFHYQETREANKLNLMVNGAIKTVNERKKQEKIE